MPASRGTPRLGVPLLPADLQRLSRPYTKNRSRELHRRGNKCERVEARPSAKIQKNKERSHGLVRQC
jgi:hypothetical protein